MKSQESIAARVASLQARSEAAARRAGRDASDVTLVAVAKGVSASDISQALQAGIRHVGESYVQEARAKMAAVREQALHGGFAEPRWHMIGRLQRNKAREIARLFDCIESVDRSEIARTLDAAAGERVLEVLLQVNVSGETQKAGVDPEHIDALLAICAGLSHLRVSGLMAIPAASTTPEQSRPAFARLRKLRDSLRRGPGGENLRELSMGMSNDFETAIEEGATRVRIGTALFGARKT